jgi:ubiquitin thioesterase OTU1
VFIDKTTNSGVFSIDDEQIKKEVMQIAKVLKEKNKFTDTKTFKIKCNVCYTLFKGQEDVVSHSKSTGHGNFVQLG